MLAALVWPLVQLASCLYFALVSIAFTCLNALRRADQVRPVDESDGDADLLHVPAVELARRIRSGALSSERLLRAYIGRAERVNGVINAIVVSNVDSALRRARQVDEQVQIAVASDVEPFPRMHFIGVPFTVKDCAPVKGLPVSVGLRSKREKAEVCDRTAACIERMESAGAILLYVTNIPPLCFWWETGNNAYGKTNNPHCSLHTTAGSSGGEGSLITACGSLIGIGTDLGGSIRMPAHCAGIYGHKPSPGAVSNDGYLPGLSEYQYTMNTFGPLCRYLADVKPMLAAMGEPNVLRTLRLDEHVDLCSIKVFVFEEIRSPLVGPLDCHQRAALHSVVRYLETSRRMHCTHIDLPLMHWIVRMWCNDLTTDEYLKNWSLAATLKELPAAFKGESDTTIPVKFIGAWLPLFRKIATTIGPDPAQLTSMREHLQRDLDTMLGDDGVLIMPSHATLPPYHHQALFQPFNLAYTIYANSLGVPATCVPVALAHSKLGKGPRLPASVQVMAKGGNDRLCLEVAQALDEAFGGWKGPGT